MIITCKAVAYWIVYLSVWRDGRLGLWHYHRGISDGVEAFLQKWWRSCHLGKVRRSITSEAHSVLQSRTPTLLLLQIITGRHDVRLLLKVFFFVRIFLFLINMPRCTFTPPAALRNNLFRKHNGWLTMHVFDITLSAFELLDFYLAAPVFRYRSWCRGFYFDQRLALSHRPQVAKTWYICDNSIVKPRNPPKKAVRKMLTTCQDVNTIAVKPRFTVPANWFEVSLLGFFVLIFFFCYGPNGSRFFNVAALTFKYLSENRMPSDYIVVDELLNRVGCWLLKRSIVHERLTLRVVEPPCESRFYPLKPDCTFQGSTSNLSDRLWLIRNRRNTFSSSRLLFLFYWFFYKQKYGSTIAPQ